MCRTSSVPPAGPAPARTTTTSSCVTGHATGARERQSKGWGVCFCMLCWEAVSAFFAVSTLGTAWHVGRPADCCLSGAQSCVLCSGDTQPCWCVAQASSKPPAAMFVSTCRAYPDAGELFCIKTATVVCRHIYAGPSMRSVWTPQSCWQTYQRMRAGCAQLVTPR
jgi:hypothetical protein